MLEKEITFTSEKVKYEIITESRSSSPPQKRENNG